METEANAIFQVDNRELRAQAGENLLHACLANGIFIPNLCFIAEQTQPHASCRLCFVEIEGLEQPVTACTQTVRSGLVVHTDTPRVRQLQRSGLRLLLSAHHVDCKNCPANKRCALQDMAQRLKIGLKPKDLDQWLKTPEVDSRHPHLDYYPNRCVLCAKCIYQCQEIGAAHALTFAKRGFDTVVSFFGGGNGSATDCQACRACVDICPVAALQLRNDPSSGNTGRSSPTGTAKS